MDNEFDFSGYATRNDLVCNDGRIIRRNAFKHCDGEQVPLIYSHDHKDVKSVKVVVVKDGVEYSSKFEI